MQFGVRAGLCPSPALARAGSSPRLQPVWILDVLCSGFLQPIQQCRRWKTCYGRLAASLLISLFLWVAPGGRPTPWYYSPVEPGLVPPPPPPPVSHGLACASACTCAPRVLCCTPVASWPPLLFRGLRGHGEVGTPPVAHLVCLLRPPLNTAWVFPRSCLGFMGWPGALGKSIRPAAAFYCM